MPSSPQSVVVCDKKSIVPTYKGFRIPMGLWGQARISESHPLLGIVEHSPRSLMYQPQFGPVNKGTAPSARSCFHRSIIYLNSLCIPFGPSETTAPLFLLEGRFNVTEKMVGTDHVHPPPPGSIGRSLSMGTMYTISGYSC